MALLAYVRDPIVRGAILMSGPANLTGAGGYSQFRRVAVNAGCAASAAAAAAAATSTVAMTGTTAVAASAPALNSSGGVDASAAAGAPTEDERRVLECMRSLDARQLVRAMPALTVSDFTAAPGLPRYDDTLVFPPSEISRRVHAGQFARIVSGYLRI